MSLTKLTKLLDIHEQIKTKKTGRPAALAKKLGISERTLYNYIKELRSIGAPILYCPVAESYVYKKDWHFEIWAYLWKYRK